MQRTGTTLMSVAVALGLTILTGLWHGRVTHRWGAPAPVKEAAEQLTKLPTEFGDWMLESTYDLEPDVQAILQCTGSLHHRYVNRRTGHGVQVAVLLGPANNISVHTPEICYTGAGYKPTGETQHLQIEDTSGASHQIALTYVARDGDLSTMQAAAYGWTLGSEFVTPKNPRWTYRNESYLYKFQLAAHVDAPGNATKEEIEQADRALIEEFLKEFLPTLRPFLLKFGS